MTLRQEALNLFIRSRSVTTQMIGLVAFFGYGRQLWDNGGIGDAASDVVVDGKTHGVQKTRLSGQDQVVSSGDAGDRPLSNA